MLFRRRQKVILMLFLYSKYTIIFPFFPCFAGIYKSEKSNSEVAYHLTSLFV